MLVDKTNFKPLPCVNVLNHKRLAANLKNTFDIKLKEREFIANIGRVQAHFGS